MIRWAGGLATIALAAPAAAAPVEHLRTPIEASGPVYDLDLALSDVDRRFEGTVRIALRNPTDGPLDVLPLVIHPNATAPGLIGGGRPGAVTAGDPASLTGPVTVDQLTASPPATWATGHPSEVAVRFAEPVPPGGEIVVEARFHGTLRPLRDDVNDLFAQGMEQLRALGRAGGGGDYGLLATGDGITVAASAFPMVVPAIDGAFARRVLRPDRPIGDLAWNAPATFRARIVTPAGLRVVTNGVDRPGPPADGRQVVLVEARQVSDLVVVAARDWVVAERDVGGVKVRSWARARDRDAGAAVLDEGVRALRWLEGKLGRYPFTELDLVEASLVGGAGGVEFGSLALIAGFLYTDPGRAGSPFGALVPGLDLSAGVRELAEQRGFVVAHEVAHQWAPGIVTVDAWNHPVVDEPLAQYLAWRVVTEGEPAAEAAEVRDRMVSAGYGLHRLLGGVDGAADRATSGFGSSLEYAALVYGKAPGLYFALERSVGRPALDRALRAAVRDRAWRASTPAQWLAALEAGGATGAVALGERWWSGAHGDADLGLDPAGEAALEWMLGADTARQMRALLAPLGLSPAALLRQVLSGGGPAPAPGPAVPGLDLEQLLRQLDR